MNPWDAGAFLATALAVLFVNAALAVAIGCSFYVVRAMLGRRPPLAQAVRQET
jgi:hypothetical protein